VRQGVCGIWEGVRESVGLVRVVEELVRQMGRASGLEWEHLLNEQGDRIVAYVWGQAPGMAMVTAIRAGQEGIYVRSPVFGYQSLSIIGL